MTNGNGPRGAVTFLSWLLVAVAAVLAAGFVYNVFVGPIFP